VLLSSHSIYLCTRCHFLNRFLYSLAAQTSDACGAQYLAWPVPLPSGVCLYASRTQLEGLSERAARGIRHLVRPTSGAVEAILSLGDTLVFLVAAPGRQQHNKHTDRLEAIDRPDNERVYLLSSLPLLQADHASFQLRQARPHSCIRHCTPPVWSAAASSSSIAAARQVCLRPRSLFSLTHRPPACKRIVAQSPTCVQCGEPAVGRLAGWREQAVPQNSTPQQHTHTLPLHPSLSACVLPSETARR